MGCSTLLFDTARQQNAQEMKQRAVKRRNKHFGARSVKESLFILTTVHVYTVIGKRLVVLTNVRSGIIYESFYLERVAGDIRTVCFKMG
jgi:hypothetical protein